MGTPGRYRLLLLGDGSAAAAGTWRALEAGGLEVLLASTLSEALEMLAQNELSAVLLFGDNRARLSPLLDRIVDAAGGRPVIVLTTLDDRGFEQRMLEGGATDCLRHGALRDEQLARMLRRLVEAARARDDLVGLKETLKANNRRLSRLRSRRQNEIDEVVADLRQDTYEVLTQAELLLRDLRGPLNDGQREAMAILRDAARRLGRIVENVRDASEPPPRAAAGAE